MTGVLAGVIGSVKKAASGPTNIMVNGSATSATNPFFGGSGFRNTTYFKTTPASWQMNDVGNGPELTYFAATGLTIGQTYSMSWWSRNDPVNGSEAVTFSPLSFSGGTGTTSYTPGATFTYYKLENMTATSVGVYFQFTGSNFNSLFDDIWIVAGATAF
jgi:hypothetical protein